MDPQLARMLDLQYFHANGYIRKDCPTCKDPFWTRDAALTHCGDSTCVEYDFIGNPLTNKPLSLPEMREAFQAFFENHEHTRVPRNPVVARWRDDIYLNIASIANYQPHITSGDVDPPANPLVVSQPCIRLNDLSNIGRSGRHFSCFEMMGHHAFNRDGDEKYWTEECVQYGMEFLVDVLGLDAKRITLKEHIWHGGGNAGPALEVFAGGLEVATWVFMNLEEHEEGSIEIQGDMYRIMPLRIIDTGWGLERLAWASTGTPTAYDTVFPEILSRIQKAATVEIAMDERAKTLVSEHARVQGVLNLDIGTSLDGLREQVVERLAAGGLTTTKEELQTVMAPIEAMYGLADHLRCLSFMVGDGVVPGNVKAGYLMRLMFRRAFRYQADLGMDGSLGDMLVANMESMLKEFPEFTDALGRAKEMTELEFERYIESRDRGLRLVERTIKKKPELTVEDLIEFYDTHGLGPNTVAEAAAKLGVTVEVPDTFDALVAERHSKEKKVKAKAIVPADVQVNRRVFYEENVPSMEATVTWVGTVGKQHACTLDATPFFHETGGQPGDVGTLGSVQVTGTKKDGDHVIHFLDGEVSVGDAVTATVDWNVRMDHARSHTATHIMNQTVRRVLGSHSWQAGTQKYRDCARVDMSHYRRPSAEDLVAIERLANRIVMEARPVTAQWLTRDVAELQYGMSLLQGGIPKGRDVRVVTVGKATHTFASTAECPDIPADEDYDVEYCGGTHLDNTNQVGPIRLYRTERVQDGVERFEYSAGIHAVGRWQETTRLLAESSEALSVSPPELPSTASRFFDEWKERGKLLEEVQRQLAALKAAAAGDAAEEINGIRVIVQTDLDAGALQQTAANLIAEGNTIALLAAPSDGPTRLLFARSEDVDVNMGNVLRVAAEVMGGKGGGRPDFAQGAGPDASKISEAMDAARAALK